MKKDKINFPKGYLLIFTCIMLSACNNQMDYKSIIDQFSSEELLCISLLEVEGVNLFLGEAYTGSCLTYDDKFSRKSGLESYVDGKIEGISIGYYPSGKVEFIGYKKNGEINGKYIRFYENGETHITGQFKNGLYVGIFKFYNDRGEIIERKKYNQFGILLKSKTY